MKQNDEIIDLRELATRPQGEALEFLGRELGRRKGLKDDWSGRGPDQGRDLIFIEIKKGSINNTEIIWLVQCKDHSVSGSAVNENELGSIIDKVRQHKANGFLLITTTTASTSLKSKLDALNINNGGEIFTYVWDKHEIISQLLQPSNKDLIKQYFPKSYKKYISEFGSIDDALEILSTKLPPKTFDKIENLISIQNGEHISKNEVIAKLRGTNDISEILASLRIDDDINKAISLSENLNTIEFVKLITILSSIDENMVYDFLKDFITSSTNPNLNLNAFQHLNENFELNPNENINLSTYLDNDALYRIYGDEIINWLIKELFVNTTSYSVWSEIDSLSSASSVNDICIEDISFSTKNRDRVLFNGHLSMEVELSYDKGDDESIYEMNFPGEFSGYFDEHGIYLEDVSIDTRKFYE
ncbi:MAG: restriction endonuclease [candidate division Zixibacteria bacterium]|nr:restriction endonuclease [candidate division Zixibacteria bacterium]